MSTRRQQLVAAVVVILLFGAGFAAQRVSDNDTSTDPPDETATATSTTTSTPTTTEAAPSTTEPSTTTTTATPSTTTTAAVTVVVEVLPVEPPDAETAISYAEILAPAMTVPSNCGLPYEVAASLPNSPRDYRSGTHQGVDFICLERGRDAVAARDGRVVVAVGDYTDPTPADRGAVLDIAADAGGTPIYTLVMLYGNYVVIDHGVVDGVGHVVSIYAHLEEVDPAIAPGVLVTAGQRLGEIGNKGTDSSSRGTERPQSIHLHWEIHIDGLYLGAGLGASETREVYERLFPR